jgi:MFS family permease
VVGSVILINSHFSIIFLASAIVGAIAFLLALLLPATTQRHSGGIDDDDDEGFSLRAFMAVFREPRLAPWYAITVVNMFFVGILFGFLPVLIHAAHYDTLQSGVLLSAVAASYLLVQPVAGWLADRTHPAVTIRVGLALAGLSIVALPFTGGILQFVIAIIAGIGVGAVWTNTDALVSRLAASGRLGATMGAAGSFKEFGDMIGPLIIGLLAQVFGLPVGFVVCGILGLLTLPLIRKGNQESTPEAV